MIYDFCLPSRLFKWDSSKPKTKCDRKDGKLWRQELLTSPVIHRNWKQTLNFLENDDLRIEERKCWPSFRAMIFLLLLMLVGESSLEDEFSFTQKYCSTVMNCCYGSNLDFQIAYETSQQGERSAKSVLMQLTGKWLVQALSFVFLVHKKLLNHSSVSLSKESDEAKPEMELIFTRFAFSNTMTPSAPASSSTMANAFRGSSTFRPQLGRKKRRWSALIIWLMACGSTKATNIFRFFGWPSSNSRLTASNLAF